MNRFAVYLAAGFAASALAAATGLDVNWILNRLARSEKNIESVSFGFTQKIVFTETDLNQNIEGTAFFLRPNKLKIIRRDPREQITISNGKKVWVYTPSYKQVWIADWKNWQKSTGFWPKGVVSIHDLSSYLRKEFNLTAERAWGGSYVRLKGRPKEQALGYQLDVVISTRTWLPAETEYNSGSARIVTRMKNVEINPDYEDDDFNFTPPDGVEVIPFQ